MDIDSEQSQGKCVHLDDEMMTDKSDRLMESRPGDKTCEICSIRSTTLWNCTTCKNLMCDFCGGYSHDLFEAASPFFGNVQPPAWNKPKCFSCQTVEEHDTTVISCLEMVAGAVVTGQLSPFQELTAVHRGDTHTERLDLISKECKDQLS